MNNQLRRGGKAVGVLVVLCVLSACGEGGEASPPTTPRDNTPPVTSANPGGGTYGVAQVVTLTASEQSVIYYTTDGSDPVIGQANTISGASPITNIQISVGTTSLKFFAVDAASNQETPIKAETYVIDLVSPTISLVGPGPGLFGLLTMQEITWQSNETGVYVVELGGTGTLGTGTQLASGNVTANTSVPQQVRGSDLSFTSPTSLWIYVTDAVGHMGATSVALSLKALVSIPLGGVIRQVRLLPNGEKAYIARTDANTAAVIDTNPVNPSFHTVLTNIPVGIRPSGIAVTPNGTRVYVTNSGSTITDIDSITVIDSSIDSVSVTSPLGSNTTPNGIAVTPDGTRAYFTTFVERVMILDTDPVSPTFNLVIGNVPIPLLLSGSIAMTPDGTKAVINWGGMIATAVHVLDVNPASPTYNTVLGAPVPVVAGSPGDVTISPDSSFAYVSHGISTCWFCKIDLQSLTIDLQNTSAPFAGSIGMTPDGQTLLTGNANSPTLSVFTTSDLSQLGGVDIGGPIGDIAVVPDGTRAYVVRDPVSLTSELVMVPLQ